MYERYPLFHSHIDLAHNYWKDLITPGDTVIDATCGNGYDTLILAELALTQNAGTLYALDLQTIAIENTRQKLQNQLSSDIYTRIHFIQGCHSQFPKEIIPRSTKLITYNLGYLPSGDKKKTTTVVTTLQSIQHGLDLICNGGAISITIYPGHLEGKEEEDSLLQCSSLLDPKKWSSCYHRWTNRRNSPSLLLIQNKLW